MLNLLWLGFFIVAAVSAVAQWLLAGQAQVFAAMVESLFTMAKLSVEVMVLLFGTLTMWLGFLRIAEKAGIVDALARWLSPLFARLMPEVPRGHPALGLMTLNFAANALGLPFTPIGVEEYDLVIPRRFFDGDAVQALLDVIRSKAFRQTVEGLGGYGTEKTGQIIWEYAGKQEENGVNG